MQHVVLLTAGPAHLADTADLSHLNGVYGQKKAAICVERRGITCARLLAISTSTNPENGSNPTGWTRAMCSQQINNATTV